MQNSLKHPLRVLLLDSANLQFVQAACALQATADIPALAGCATRVLRRQLQLGGMEASALFRLERLHRVQAHAAVPDAVRVAVGQLSAQASVALVQQGGLLLHELALLKLPALLQSAVTFLLDRDNGRLVASYGYDYIPLTVTQLFQSQVPPNTITELPVCLLARLKPLLSQSFLQHLHISNAIPHDVAEALLKVTSSPDDLGVTSLHTPLRTLDLQIGRVPTHVLCSFVSSLTNLTCLKLQNLVTITPIPGDTNPDWQPSLNHYPPQIPGHQEPFPIHARKPFARVIGDPIQMIPITQRAAAQSPAGARSRGAARNRGSSSASPTTVPPSPTGAMHLAHRSPSGMLPSAPPSLTFSFRVNLVA